MFPTAHVSYLSLSKFSGSYRWICIVGGHEYHVQPRPKTRNPSWKLLLPASTGKFRFKRFCQRFFALQWSQQRTFQIFCWVIFWGVMVGCASLVVTNIMYNHDQKFHIKELTTLTFRIQVQELALLQICMQGLGRRNIVDRGVVTICVQILMFK